MKEIFATYKKTIINVLIVVILMTLALFIISGVISGTISEFLSNFLEIVAPITVGFIIAYLSNPIVTFFEKRIFKWIRNFKIKRFISILVTLLLVLIFISTIIMIIIPSLINTLVSFWETYVVEYENTIRSVVQTINSTMDRFDMFDSVERLDPDGMVILIKEKFPIIDDFVNGDFTEIIPNVSGTITQNIAAIFDYVLLFGTSIFNVIKNTILGIFIAFYMLMSKEKTKAYIRRFLNSFLPPKKVRSVVRFGKLLDRTFGGFIEGQLLDAIVIGIISYFTFMLFKLPIPHLLATIIAVTNVIPIFGPFIGGVPAAFLVLLTAPEKTILFIILIIIIQQIDGNIICPHILGDRINISSLATIVAILTMGGLFGFFGMIIGVPIFAVAIHLINDYTMNSLRKKGLETSLSDYYVGNIETIESKPIFKNKFIMLFNKSKAKKSIEKITKNNNKEK